MLRRPPRSTLFPYTTALPIFTPSAGCASSPLPRRSSRSSAACHRRPATWRRGRSASSRSWRRRSARGRSEEHTSELQSHSDLVCRLLLEKKKDKGKYHTDLDI